MIIDEEAYDFLEHFGVKGMKWGVRNDRPTGVSAKTNRQAKKDAHEFARAKMFYGEGAGTRRKLIKASVDAKSKRSPEYKKAFDHHLARQDMSTHADKARGERKRTDRAQGAKKTSLAVARRFTGEMGNHAAILAAGAAGVAYLSSAKGQQTLKRGMSTLTRVAEKRQAQQGVKKIEEFLKKTA